MSDSSLPLSMRFSFVRTLSMKWWLTLLILGVVSVVVVVSWVLVNSTLDGRLKDQELQTLRSSLGLAQQSLDVAGDGSITSRKARQALQYESVIVDGRLNARMVILDESARRVLADSRVGMPLNLADYPLAMQTTLSGTTESQIVDQGRTKYAAAASVISLGANPVGGPPNQSAVLMLVGSLDNVESNIAIVRERLALAFGAGFAIATLTGFLAAYVITRRLRIIEQGAQVIAEGDFTAAIRVRLHDEIGQLAEGFNTMGRRLADVFRRMELHDRRTSAILDTLEEGLMGIDAEGRISIASRAAQVMLGPSTEGTSLEAAAPPQVTEIWRLCSQDGQSHTTVIASGARTLEATIYPIYPVDQATDTHFAVALRDVTSEERLEHARRAFLANASHELKTPLFSLAGYVDILAEDRADEEQRMRCVQIIKQQVDRMRRLTVDLLDLTRIDAGAIELHPTEVNLAAVLPAISDEFEASASSRGIRLECRCDAANQVVIVDGERLGQILRILLDNAVKFSADNEAVLLELTVDDDSFSVSVADTGRSIAGDEVALIFDRFYVGREGRKFKEGSGLGLPIARELAQHMGGHLGVEVSTGRRVTFRVCLPLDRSTLQEPSPAVAGPDS